MQDLLELLRNNPYPGRGIVVGRGRVYYWIMGRSSNSRNRVFELTEDGIRTKAFDESKMVDPSLIIYHPVRQVGDKFVVTNGDQTDTIRDFLVEGKTAEAGLRTREFEPDGPNWTPRVSGVRYACGGYQMSILKSADPEGSACTRNFFEYAPKNGVGRFISTYEGFGSPLPSFHGEPVQMELPQMTAKEYAEAIWNALNADNKVSLYVKLGEEVIIINKHQEV